MLVLGVDIGGTFTDFSLVDIDRGSEFSLKLPTDHAQLERPVIAGMETLLNAAAPTGEGLAYVTHGSTIAVNTVIERTGSALGLICTDGFGDVLELRRVRLRIPMRFNATRPDPLISRARVREITERTAPDGSVLAVPSEDEVVEAVKDLVEAGAEAIVVALLHSYMNSSNEETIKRMIEGHWGEMPVYTSSGVLPQMREYERTVCTALDAYVSARVGTYIRDLADQAKTAGHLKGQLYITKSNGGCSTAAEAMRRPVQTLLSGPAAGVVGACDVASQAGYPNVITFDMGGTSTDIGVIRDGRMQTSRDSQVGDFPVILPAVEVTSIGAGGSSVAYVSASGVLRVGPRSAGSSPGPACYGHGGSEPTVTDALLQAGILNAGTFAGGNMGLQIADAERALARLGETLDLSADECADAIVRIATAQMTVGLKGVISRHGLDPNEFALLAFGGAGPVFATLLAREVGIKEVIVPLRPGTLCAHGSLVADLRGDFVRTIHKEMSSLSGIGLCAAVESLEKEAGAWLQRNQGGDVEIEHEIVVTAAMRYVGQAWELDVPLERSKLTAERAVREATSGFHTTHKSVYGHADPASAVELVELHVSVIGHRQIVPNHPAGRPSSAGSGSGGSPGSARVYRSVMVDANAEQLPIYERAALRAGDVIDGPAIVEQGDTTTLVSSHFRVRVDESLNMILGRR